MPCNVSGNRRKRGFSWIYNALCEVMFSSVLHYFIVQYRIFPVDKTFLSLPACSSHFPLVVVGVLMRSCSIFYVQFCCREKLPLHSELRTIMLFGTAELVIPVSILTGSDGLIGFVLWRVSLGCHTHVGMWKTQLWSGIEPEFSNTLFCLFNPVCI